MLQSALQHPTWINHSINDTYLLINKGGIKDTGIWKISYYPLFGTYKENVWIEFNEPKALIEKPIFGGTDFREVPLRYLEKKAIAFDYG